MRNRANSFDTSKGEIAPWPTSALRGHDSRDPLRVHYFEIAF